MDVNSFVIGYNKGKASAPPAPSVEPQEKEITITENGTTHIEPDEGKLLSKVTITTDVGPIATEFPADRYFEGGYADIVLPNAEKIRSCAFYNYSGLKTVSAPRVTQLETRAFEGATGVVSVDFPSLTNIGSRALYNCSKLANTELPSGLVQIGSSAFFGCSNLAITELPDSITNIDSNAFENCSKIAITKFPPKLAIISSSAFRKCNAIEQIELHAGISTIQPNCFSYCANLKTVVFKGKPSKINGGFEGCEAITDIYVPWAEGEVAFIPGGAINATVHYNFSEMLYHITYNAPNCTIEPMVNIVEKGGTVECTIYANEGYRFTKLLCITGEVDIGNRVFNTQGNVSQLYLENVTDNVIVFITTEEDV